MNTESTVEKMKQMRLFGMSDLYHQTINEHLFADHTRDQIIALLVDAEWENRYNNKIKNLIRVSGLPASISSEDIDYTTNRGLDKNMFERLLTLKFIKQKENLILTGATGVGKSYLAQAIGNATCRQTMKTQYYNCGKLSELVKLSKLEGTYIKLLKKISRASLLIIDDFGLYPFDNPFRSALMDIIEERYEKASTIITSQIPVSKWHETIGEGTIADAILDRMVYSSHRIDLRGQSMRKNKKLKG